MESISRAELFWRKQIYLLMSVFHPKVSNGQLKKFLLFQILLIPKNRKGCF